MADDREHLRKGRPEPKRSPKEIALDILNTPLEIKGSVKSPDGIVFKKGDTAAHFLEKYMTFEDRMTGLSDLIEDAKEDGDTARLAHLEKIRAQYDGMEQGVEPKTEEERQNRAEALKFGEDTLDANNIYIMAMQVVRKIAADEPLQTTGSLSETMDIHRAAEALAEHVDIQQSVVQDLRALIGDSGFREGMQEMGRGTVDLSKQGKLPDNPEEVQRHGASLPDNPNDGEELSIAMGNVLMKTQKEQALATQALAKFNELSQALGRGWRR